jgi:hypothetical protein
MYYKWARGVIPRAPKGPHLLHPPLSLKRLATAAGFRDYRHSKPVTGHLFCFRYQTQIG